MGDGNGNGDSKAVPIKILGVDERSRKYQAIADVHKQLVESKWKSRACNAPIQIHPALIFHLEESVHFLAQELLALFAEFETNGNPHVQVRPD